MRSLSFKAASLIKSSLPSGFPGDSENEGETNSRPDSPGNTAKDIAASLTETASSVLNRINPFDSPKHSFDKGDTSARLISKLERTLGLHDEDGGSQEENEPEFSYANENDEDDDTEMLEYNQTPDGESSSLLTSSANKSKKKKPVGGLEYEVQFSNETIEKIALKFNTVPSEILRLNRFSTRRPMLFPGQVIYVPDPEYVPPSPPPAPADPATPVTTKSQDDEINGKSPNNQSTPVMSGFNIFKWKTNNSAKPGTAERQKSFESDKAQRLNSNESRHVITEDEAKQLDEECMQRFLKINCKIVTRSKGCHEGVIIITPSAIMFDPINAGELGEQKENQTSSANAHGPIYDEASAIIPIELISNVIMYEDLHLKDVEEYFEYQQELALLEYDIVSTSNTTRKSEVSFQIEQQDSLIKNSADNEEFRKNTEDFLAEDEVFPDESTEKRPSESSTQPTCYICFKVNHNKNVVQCPMDRKMKNKLKSEFWFQIYDDCFKNTDKICAFFLEWRPESTEYNLTPEQNRTKRRFRLLKEDERLGDLIAENLTLNSFSTLSFNKSGKFNSSNRLINKEFFIKDWEIVNLNELESKLKLEMEIEKEYNTLPILASQSDILKEDHLRKLNVNLIPRAMGYTWLKTFSTNDHGFSLKHLYRTLSDVETPCLIIVQDTVQNIFGVMTDSKLYPSEHYYGTGECFLFTFYPSFKVFKWTGENNFFMRGNNEGVGFGCGEGYHGLWFDGDLLNGHTQKSKTFDNEPLTSDEYFTLASLEVWTFSEES